MQGTKATEYFIGHYLRSGDVFERARAIMLLRFSIIFGVLFLLPLAADITNGFHKALVLHSIDEFLLILFPFLIKRSKRLEPVINLFFAMCFIASFGAYLTFNPMKIDPIATAWALCFLTLSALLQRGWPRILYCCLGGWLPSLYVFMNIKLDGILTVDWLLEHGANNPPIGMAIVPALITIYAIWSHTQTIEEAKQTITRQKAEIEEKNISITDSINYAKRIQEAILPDQNQLKKLLPNSFVLYKPKDIVSGDFYFLKEHGQYILLAAADCTGHGVPGAFMSMIGSEQLKEASQQSADVGTILKTINRGIRNSLKQTETTSTTRDGMDIALCAIDPGKRQLRYAGANRPLWIIRKNSNEIEEIKATKKAIGGFTEEGQDFQAHELNLVEGDTIYMSTDGYADSFGGQKNKKLTTRKFKELLLRNKDKSMADQALELRSFIESWTRATEQIDDILVIGVRL